MPSASIVARGRVGHLFQNRLKSILCQENRYLKQLVGYIHLNLVRVEAGRLGLLLGRQRFGINETSVGKLLGVGRSAVSHTTY